MLQLNSIDGPVMGRKVKADVTVGPILKGETYSLIEIKPLTYVLNVGGIHLTYPKEYFFYKG